MAEYVVYPSNRGTSSLARAKRMAREDGRGSRVENARTEKVVYRVNPGRRKAKKRTRTTKRVPASVTRFMKRLNPSKMKGVRKVRVRRLKGGGVTIIPVKG